MQAWLESLIQNWDWAVFWPEVVGKAVGVTLGILISWFLVIRRRLQSLGKLRRGDSDDILFQAHYLHPIEGGENGGSVQLLFRNVAEKRTVEQVYDNPAAAALVRELGDETTLDQPILPTLGTIGFEVLNDAAGWISGSVATSSNERQVWLFCLTAEDRQVVRKRCVRCFLIRPDDLAKFHDWTWCQTQVRLERPWHWFRVVALHRIARVYVDQQVMYSSPGNPGEMPLVDDQAGHRRIIPLSLGLMPAETPIGPAVVIDWDEHLKKFASMRLRLEAAAAPSAD